MADNFPLLPPTEEELAAIRQEALEFAGIGLYRYRFDGIVHFIDRGALRIFELDDVYPDPNMASGKNIGDLIVYQRPPGMLREQIRSQGHARNLEYPFITLKGHQVWAMHDSYLVRDEQTGDEYIQVIIQDVTERKKAAAALQQAHDELEIRVRERTASEREQRNLAEALRDIATLLNSTLQLDEVLDRILAEIRNVVPHDSANLLLLENEHVRVVRSQLSADLPSSDIKLGTLYPIQEWPGLQRMIQDARPLILNEIENCQGGDCLPGMTGMHSCLGAPIQRQGMVIGFINLQSAQPGFFSAVQGERLLAFADQAAIAIQNARLYKRAQELAAIEERQRLARDLHDAVSQTLWTAALIADVLPALWAQNQEVGMRNLERLQRMTRGALAEMRTLLLELRPDALKEARLDDLMNQLAQAVMSHKKIDILVNTQGDCTLPVETKVGLYRLAQEAVNNIAKHSHATHVDLDLVSRAGSIQLRICDNGRGFDTEKTTAGLGLGIMRERAEAIHADLKITSQIGSGSEISIVWPKPNSHPEIDPT